MMLIKTIFSICHFFRLFYPDSDTFSVIFSDPVHFPLFSTITEAPDARTRTGKTAPLQSGLWMMRLSQKVISLFFDTFMKTRRLTIVVKDRIVARAAAIPSLPRST